VCNCATRNGTLYFTEVRSQVKIIWRSNTERQVTNNILFGRICECFLDCILQNVFWLSALHPSDSCLDNPDCYPKICSETNVGGSAIYTYMVLILVTLIHFCSKSLTFGLVIFNEDLPPRKVGKWQYPPRECNTWLCMIVYAWGRFAVLKWKRLCVTSSIRASQFKAGFSTALDSNHLQVKGLFISKKAFFLSFLKALE
jgi:hypothetical protein